MEKSFEEWTTSEKKACQANSRALLALQNGVDEENFKLISTCVSAKAAWDILQTIHEGTTSVRRSKMQMINTMFEQLRMGEEETIEIFHSKIRDLANQAFILDEEISETKLVMKVLRSLPKRFEAKVAAIEEMKDPEEIKLNELIGSLQTYEMNHFGDRISKGFALKTVNEEESDSDDEDIAVLIRKLSKCLKKKDDEESRRKPKSDNKYGGNKSKGGNKFGGDKGKNKWEQNDKFKGKQCYECGGYGHMQMECANTLKKQHKNMTVTWSDDSSDESSDDDSVDNSDDKGDDKGKKGDNNGDKGKTIRANMARKKNKKPVAVATSKYPPTSGNSDHDIICTSDDDQSTDEEFDFPKDLAKKFIKLHKENERIFKNMEGLDDALSEVKNQKKVLEAELAKANNEKFVLMEELKALKETAKDVNTDVTRLSDEADDLREDMANLETEKQELKEEISRLVFENMKLQEDKIKANDEILKLQKEMALMTSRCEQLEKKAMDATQSFKRFDTGKAKLDEAIAMGRTERGHRGLGYEYGSTSGVSKERKFVKGETVIGGFLEKMESKPMLQKPRRSTPTCQYCKRSGHHTHHCYKLFHDCMNGRNMLEMQDLKKKIPFRRIWVPKEKKSEMPLTNDMSKSSGAPGSIDCACA